MMRNDSNSSLNSMLDEGGRERATKTTTTILKKGPWSAAEDAILIDYVQKHGEGSWNSVQKNCGLARCGKSCRLRWANHLRPNLKKGSFTPEEEMLILQLHAQFGNKWAHMAAQMPGRTDNEIKNYWNTRIKRRQRAGLPLYPVRMASARPPPLMATSSPPSPLQHSPVPHSQLQLFKQTALSNPLFPESPRVKRIRHEGLTFRFPVVSPYTHHPHPHQMTNNMFEYNNGSAYGNLNDMNINILMSTAGLPSTQSSNGGNGGCGLMDAVNTYQFYQVHAPDVPEPFHLTCLNVSLYGIM